MTSLGNNSRESGALDARPVFSLDVEMLISPPSSLSIEDLEGILEEAIQSAYEERGIHCKIVNLQAFLASLRSYCCPTCGGELEQRLSMKGVHKAPVNMASGLPEKGEFDGTQGLSIVCSLDSTHPIPQELVDSVSKAVEMVSSDD